MSEDCLGAKFEILLDGKNAVLSGYNAHRDGSCHLHQESESQQQRGRERPANWPSNRVAGAATVTDIPRGRRPLSEAPLRMGGDGLIFSWMGSKVFPLGGGDLCAPLQVSAVFARQSEVRPPLNFIIRDNLERVVM